MDEYLLNQMENESMNYDEKYERMLKEELDNMESVYQTDLSAS